MATCLRFCPCPRKAKLELREDTGEDLTDVAEGAGGERAREEEVLGRRCCYSHHIIAPSKRAGLRECPQYTRAESLHVLRLLDRIGQAEDQPAAAL